ncbi:MAG: hypothetical protein JOS17DRAFT_743518 [Linnemannia elongata]|nr:MAG: hypothetical protein JOS17DRAFT_743518 [Linnemannia elongata]
MRPCSTVTPSFPLSLVFLPPTHPFFPNQNEQTWTQNKQTKTNFTFFFTLPCLYRADALPLSLTTPANPPLASRPSSIPYLHLPPYCQLTIVPDQQPFLQVTIKESKNVHPTHRPRSSEIADKYQPNPLATTPHLHLTPIHSIGGRKLFFYSVGSFFFFSSPRPLFISNWCRNQANHNCSKAPNYRKAKANGRSQ